MEIWFHKVENSDKVVQKNIIHIGRKMLNLY